jgi:hypothetical protein
LAIVRQEAPEARILAKCGHHNPRREHDQRLKTPAIEWKILDEWAVNHRADRRRLGVYQRRSTFHRDSLQSGTNLHFEVDFERILNVKDHIRLD